MCQETAGGVRTTSHFFHENQCLQLLSDAMFILTASGPNARRMLTLIINKLNIALVSFFFTVFEHEGAAASLSFKQLGRLGSFLLYVLRAAAAHQESTQWGSRPNSQLCSALSGRPF